MNNQSLGEAILDLCKQGFFVQFYSLEDINGLMVKVRKNNQIDQKIITYSELDSIVGVDKILLYCIEVIKMEFAGWQP